MGLRLISPGFLASLQDLGHPGYAHLGIPTGGAADRAALRAANMLVGNEPGEAALEMHFPAPRLRFEEPALFALSGADFDARLDGEAIAPGAPQLAGAGAELVFRRRAQGVRAYLSVRGGFEAQAWLGSRSGLPMGERLLFREKNTAIDLWSNKPRWRANLAALYPETAVFRFLPGPEYDWLMDASKTLLEKAPWRLSAQSNRMACVLEGQALRPGKTRELVSSAVLPGTLQLLPDGGALILMADCQTTGGYPRLGQVIEADLPGLAQWAPGREFRLQLVDLQTAAAANSRHRQTLRIMQAGCKLKIHTR